MSNALPIIPSSIMTDRSQRTIRYLRVSVTDRCNYRCAYCMPLDGWPHVNKVNLLMLDEVERLIGLLASLGVERVRITGGEPLLRRGVPEFVGRIAAIEGIGEVAMTTNGHLLDRYADLLYAGGLRRLNVSIDSLEPAAFRHLTRGGDLSRVLAGIEAAERAGFDDIAINAVAIADVNDHEIEALTAYCWTRGWTPRFIELMPIGALSFYGAARGVPTATIVDRLVARFGVQPVEGLQVGLPRGPARYWMVTRGGFTGCRVGIISPMTDDGFCSACNRARLTAKGGLRACLADDREVSLLEPLRRGACDDELVDLVRAAVTGKREAHGMRSDAGIPLAGMTGIGG